MQTERVIKQFGMEQKEEELNTNKKYKYFIYSYKNTNIFNTAFKESYRKN